MHLSRRKAGLVCPPRCLHVNNAIILFYINRSSWQGSITLTAVAGAKKTSVFSLNKGSSTNDVKTAGNWEEIYRSQRF